jgi:beta-phosphoglucomutase
MNYKAVIFDMDGTLIDSIEADYLAWCELFEFYQKELRLEDYIPLIGIKSAEVAMKYLPVKDELELKEALAKKLVYFRNIIEEKGIKAMPFSHELVQQIKKSGLLLSLATSSRKAKVEMVMNKVGLMDYFDVVITAEDVKKGKPDPEVFTTAAHRLSVKPSECIVFEDAANGVKAAKNAQMKCIALHSERTAGLLSEADIIIESYEGLDFAELCSRLGNSKCTANNF